MSDDLKFPSNDMSAPSRGPSNGTADISVTLVALESLFSFSTEFTRCNSVKDPKAAPGPSIDAIRATMDIGRNSYFDSATWESRVDENHRWNNNLLSTSNVCHAGETISEDLW